MRKIPLELLTVLSTPPSGSPIVWDGTDIVVATDATVNLTKLATQVGLNTAALLTCNTTLATHTTNLGSVLPLVDALNLSYSTMATGFTTLTTANAGFSTRVADLEARMNDVEQDIINIIAGSLGCVDAGMSSTTTTVTTVTTVDGSATTTTSGGTTGGGTTEVLDPGTGTSAVTYSISGSSIIKHNGGTDTTYTIDTLNRVLKIGTTPYSITGTASYEITSATGCFMQSGDYLLVLGLTGLLVYKIVSGKINRVTNPVFTYALYNSGGKLGITVNVGVFTGINFIIGTDSKLHLFETLNACSIDSAGKVLVDNSATTYTVIASASSISGGGKTFNITTTGLVPTSFLLATPVTLEVAQTPELTESLVQVPLALSSVPPLDPIKIRGDAKTIHVDYDDATSAYVISAVPPELPLVVPEKLLVGVTTTPSQVQIATYQSLRTRAARERVYKITKPIPEVIPVTLPWSGEYYLLKDYNVVGKKIMTTNQVVVTGSSTATGLTAKLNLSVALTQSQRLDSLRLLVPWVALWITNVATKTILYRHAQAFHPSPYFQWQQPLILEALTAERTVLQTHLAVGFCVQHSSATTLWLSALEHMRVEPAITVVFTNF